MERTVSYQMLEANLDKATSEKAELMARIQALEAKLDQVGPSSLCLPLLLPHSLTSTADLYPSHL